MYVIRAGLNMRIRSGHHLLLVLAFTGTLVNHFLPARLCIVLASKDAAACADRCTPAPCAVPIDSGPCCACIQMPCAPPAPPAPREAEDTPPLPVSVCIEHTKGEARPTSSTKPPPQAAVPSAVLHTFLCLWAVTHHELPEPTGHARASPRHSIQSRLCVWRN